MQNTAVPSATTMNESKPEYLLPSSNEGWPDYFGPTKSCTTLIDEKPQFYHQKDPVFTMPISVKPKTKEPTAFTDNRIYVSNIPFSFREQDLAAMFYPFGRVLSVEIVTNDRGSKGFGFVTLDSMESCERARAALHESHVQGRIIEVRRATPTRKKILKNMVGEIVPPPKLQVDLRAPHSLWQPETESEYSKKSGFPSIFANNQQKDKVILAQKFCNKENIPRQSRPRCMKHSQLKLSSTGQYYLQDGKKTSEDSLLNCLGINGCGEATGFQNNLFNTNSIFGNLGPSNPHSNVSNIEKENSMFELSSMFPNHVRDQVAALLDTSSHQASSSNSLTNRAGSVGSGGRSSESESPSDDEAHAWTPNSSPDLLASLYEGSTSFHADQNRF